MDRLFVDTGARLALVSRAGELTAATPRAGIPMPGRAPLREELRAGAHPATLSPAPDPNPGRWAMKHGYLFAAAVGLLVTACAVAVDDTPRPGGTNTDRATGADVGSRLASDTVFTGAATARARTIGVSGDAEVKVVPDEVLLTIGMETWDKDLEVAKARNDAVIRRALALIAASGIDPKHVQTDFLQIEPRYETGYAAEPRFIGYFVTQALGVTLKDVGK
jgi:hypothetical protein